MSHGTVQDLGVEKLILDPRNPRLDLGPAPSQRDLGRALARNFDLLELAESLVDHGYFKEEPLVAIADGDKFIVIEGNRRLATLQVLLINGKMDEYGLRGTKWNELRDAALQRDDLGTVPVMVHEAREDVTPYLGFRHITGVKKWDPLAMARFISKHVEEALDYSGVARLIHSQIPTVRTNHLAYRLLRQASDAGIDVSYAEKEFSVLYRALSEVGIRRFIQLDIGKSPEEATWPIPASELDHFQELLGFMFGPEAVIGESRDLHTLSEVIKEPKALDKLRSTRDIEAASALIESEAEEVLSFLKRALSLLDDVNGRIHRHKNDKLAKRAAEDCKVTIDRILQTLADA